MKLQIASLLATQKFEIPLKYVEVQMQSGTNDCGLFQRRKYPNEKTILNICHVSFIAILTKTTVVMQMFNTKTSMLQLIKTTRNRLNSISALLQTRGTVV